MLHGEVIMKILFVTESLGSGGAERQLVGLAIMLKKRGFDVFVLTYYRKDFYKSLLDDNNIPNEVYDGALNRYLRFIKLTRRINTLAPDITISFLPGSNVALGIAKNLNFLKSKLIVSERNYTWNWTCRKKIYFSLYKNADAIITNSKAEADNIKNVFSHYATKVSCIQNFVEFEKFKPQMHSSNETFKIITVARIIDYKNVKGLISAASVLKKDGYAIEFDWYGNDYNDGYSASVKEMIQKENVLDVFKLKEPVKNIQDYYSKYDALCLPSFKEGYPNVVVEAMSCQLPVLCSNICENPVIVESGVNGLLFDPHNVNDIVSSIKKMYSFTEKQRKDMGIRNREKVMKNNSIEMFTDKYVRIINNLAK